MMRHIFLLVLLLTAVVQAAPDPAARTLNPVVETIVIKF